MALKDHDKLITAVAEISYLGMPMPHGFVVWHNWWPEPMVVAAHDNYDVT